MPLPCVATAILRKPALALALALALCGHRRLLVSAMTGNSSTPLAGSVGVTAGLTGWGGYNIAQGTTLTYDLVNFNNSNPDR